MKTAKIQLKNGYTAKDVTAVVENSAIKVTYNEEQIWKPKNGEIVILKEYPDYMFIYEANNGSCIDYYCCVTNDESVLPNSRIYYNGIIIPATLEQKQCLQDVLKKEYGKIWDEEKCELVSPKRWRARYGCRYYSIDFCIVISTSDYYLEGDDICYDSGNYFQTKEQAEEVVEKIKRILKGE